MIRQFIQQLKGSPAEGVFNPWWHYCPMTDRTKKAPAMRRSHLHDYLASRMEDCRLLLIGEALGYQGGRFTGIPMTSERMLLHPEEATVNISSMIHFRRTPVRTSRSELCPKGFTEPTATIVWRTITQTGYAPHQILLWNAFPWHPYSPDQGALSNRAISREERRTGLNTLQFLIERVNPQQLIAVGRHAAQTLSELNLPCIVVRHPSRGGAKLFEQQLLSLCPR